MNAPFDHQVCPACREEYTLAVTQCAECHVDLVSPSLIADEDLADAIPFPPVAELVCIRVAPIPWIQALSGALEHQGVAHRVAPATAADAPEDQPTDAFGALDLFGLYVEAAEAVRARELDGAIAADVLPTAGEPLAEGETDTCPACGERLDHSASECPDCGLVFA